MHQKQRVSRKYFIPPSREAPAGCNGAGEAPGECDAERSSVDKTGGRIEATGKGVLDGGMAVGMAVGMMAVGMMAVGMMAVGMAVGMMAVGMADNLGIGEGK
jgi:hypothetical protein